MNSSQPLRSPSRISALERSQMTLAPPQNISSSAHTGGADYQDAFVNTLKGEIYEMKQRQRDYTQLTEQLRFLEGKYRQSQDDRRLMENENNHKLSQNMGYIQELIKELDILKLQNLDAESDQERLLVTIADSNLQLHQATDEYNELRAEIGVFESRNYSEKRDIERLEADLREATAISHKCYSDIQRLKESINGRDLDIRGFKIKVEQLEGELEQAHRRIALLSEAREQKDSELASIHVKIGQENHQLNLVRANLQKLDAEIQYYENLNHKHMQTQGALTKMNDQEFFRGKELANLENDRRITQKLRDDEVSALKGEIEYFKIENAKHNENGYELKSESEALKRHVALLNQQNFELSTELEKFIETDETIRRTLNRKGKVEEIRTKVDDAIMRSMYEVSQRRSPERNGRSTMDQPNSNALTSPDNLRNMTTPFRNQQFY